MLRAGDPVPEFPALRVMQSSDWQSDFLGKVTVLEFFPNVSDATGAYASLRNEMAAQFAGQPVQFGLIARGDQESLRQWLQQHRIEGTVFFDPQLDLARAWGIDLPQVVFIGRDARIAGFERLIYAAGSAVQELLTGQPGFVRIRPRPHMFGGDKPEIPPSRKALISPTQRILSEGTTQSRGPSHWAACNFELAPIMAQVYGIDETRIDLPAALRGERFDFELLLPEEESAEVMQELMRDGIERSFGVTATRENRLLDVYVMTAPNGAGSGLRESEFLGGSFSGSSTAVPWGTESTQVSSVSGSETSIGGLCNYLERMLKRFLIDETGLKSAYDFQVVNDAGTDEGLFKALREELGLVVTEVQRDVTVLSVRRV